MAVFSPTLKNETIELELVSTAMVAPTEVSGCRIIITDDGRVCAVVRAHGLALSPEGSRSSALSGGVESPAFGTA